MSQEDTNFELHRAEVDTAVQVRGREGWKEGGWRKGRRDWEVWKSQDIILFLV